MHRGTMPSLSERSDRQTRQNRPRNLALPVPERPLGHGEFSARRPQLRVCVPEVKHHIIDMSLNASEILARWMKCGVLSARRATNAGCGLQSIITREPSWPISLTAEKMRAFSG